MDDSVSDDGYQNPVGRKRRSSQSESRSQSRSRSRSQSRSPGRGDAKDNGTVAKGDGNGKDGMKTNSVHPWKMDAASGAYNSKHTDRRESRERSPERQRRSRSRSKEKKKKRRSRSGSKERRRRSRSNSRDRRFKRGSRSSRSRSRERRRRSRSSSRERRRRSRSRSPSKSKRRGGRGSSKERRKRRSRSRSRSPRRSRSPAGRGYGKRSKSRSPRRYSPRRRYPQSPPDRRKTICRAVLPPSFGKDKDRVPTTEEVEAKLKAHMEKMKEKASEDAKNVNLPSYLNPAMVNVQQFKQQQEKRKLLWSSKKANEESITTEVSPQGASWGGSSFQDDETEAKFRRLMGIKGAQSVGSGNQVEKSRKVLEDLEREYERSRAFQLSRGAGGTTGIGLGFNQAP